MNKNCSEVRVRFAPSPTGYLHVGGVRTLFFNWLFAKKNNGKFILRIEDTDQVRSTKENETLMISDIINLGFKFDEGPCEGGKFGPYRQSERLFIYAKYARQLLDEQKVYYCFCSDELLTQKRKAALTLGRTPHYDGTCAKISLAEAEKRLQRGEKAGLRFKVIEKDYVLEDLVRDQVAFKTGMVGDFFITRTPTTQETEVEAGIGMPVYNFCCAIDDHLMEISHVIRGEEHLSNTVRQLMIYEAFGWKPPLFAHTAMVLGQDKQKLSKRNGDVSTHDYLDKGYFPEALLNFLSLLGWWPPQGYKTKSGHPEIISLDELTQIFDLSDLQKAPAVFDIEKLKWMNSYYMRHFSLEEITNRAKSFFHKAGLVNDDQAWFQLVIDTVRGEAVLLSELPEKATLFFETTPFIEEQAIPIAKQPLSLQIIEQLLEELKSCSETIPPAVIDMISKKISMQTGAKGKELFMPIRIAITGRTHGPELKKILPLLGKEKVIQRIEFVKKALDG
ncbi:MAG: glutamate--tRNA ligase [Bdellovibrio sp.]|nr:glutamate--tRNA ligase [Bdellovibrio sp.]